MKLQEEKLHMWNYLTLAVWEALAGGASHGMNVSRKKTPLSKALLQPSLTLNTAPKEWSREMAELGAKHWPESGL